MDDILITTNTNTTITIYINKAFQLTNVFQDRYENHTTKFFTLHIYNMPSDANKNYIRPTQTEPVLKTRVTIYMKYEPVSS
jgi:hypothetical protein